MAFTAGGIQGGVVIRPRGGGSGGGSTIDGVARALAQVDTMEAGEPVPAGYTLWALGKHWTNSTAGAINAPGALTEANILAAGFTEEAPAATPDLKSGLSVSARADGGLDVSAGTLEGNAVAAMTNATFDIMLRDGSISAADQSALPLTFDDAGAVTPLAIGQMAAHDIYIHKTTSELVLLLGQHLWPATSYKRPVAPAALDDYCFLATTITARSS